VSFKSPVSFKSLAAGVGNPEIGICAITANLLHPPSERFADLSSSFIAASWVSQFDEAIGVGQPVRWHFSARLLCGFSLDIVRSAYSGVPRAKFSSLQAGVGQPVSAACAS
jgi:hypothetical protein